ncbi:MAG: hypothetical protein ABH846_02465 [Patescibacteria group bacterium]
MKQKQTTWIILFVMVAISIITIAIIASFKKDNPVAIENLSETNNSTSCEQTHRSTFAEFVTQSGEYNLYNEICYSPIFESCIGSYTEYRVYENNRHSEFYHAVELPAYEYVYSAIWNGEELKEQDLQKRDEAIGCK